MKHTLNGEQEGRFTGPKRRFMAQEGRFTEILDVLTTALLADMKRARWSASPTVCADYEGHGFDFTVYVNREGTADILFATDANKDNPLLEESASDANETNHLLETFLKEELPTWGDLYEMCRQDEENAKSTLDEGFASWDDFFNYKQIH
jgi:hypothetical protein